MKPTRIGSVQTINVQTGEVVSEKQNAMTMLPPAGDVCQECAVQHGWEEPHNQQSLYYQMHFMARHGRSATWTDAMAHCTPKVKAHWRRELVRMMEEKGMPIPADLQQLAEAE